MHEIELQYLYLGAGDPEIPAKLIGLNLADQGILELDDSYFDSPSREKITVRLRHCLPDDLYIITVKGPKKVIEHGSSRSERESESRYRPTLSQIRSFAYHNGIDLAVAKSLIFKGKLLNKRHWYLYGSPSSGIEIAYDQLSFPDGTSEKRLEVEIKGNPEVDFKKLINQLGRHFGPQIIPATMSKGQALSEVINKEKEHN